MKQKKMLLVVLAVAGITVGGLNGTTNPGLTSDHVNTNDKAFTETFPYLATPH